MGHAFCIDSATGLLIINDDGLLSTACPLTQYAPGDCCCYLDSATLAWSSATTYAADDLAEGATKTYKSLQDNNLNHNLGDTEWWVQVSSIKDCGNADWDSEPPYGGVGKTPYLYKVVISGAAEISPTVRINGTYILSKHSVGCTWTGSDGTPMFICQEEECLCHNTESACDGLALSLELYGFTGYRHLKVFSNAKYLGGEYGVYHYINQLSGADECFSPSGQVVEDGAYGGLSVGATVTYEPLKFGSDTGEYHGAWAQGQVYEVTDIVREGNLFYGCTAGHTSDASTRPGTGENWTDKWVVLSYLVQPLEFAGYSVYGGDLAAWDSETSYARCDLVVAGAVPGVYRSLIDDNEGNDPTTSPAAWLGLGYYDNDYCYGNIEWDEEPNTHCSYADSVHMSVNVPCVVEGHETDEWEYKFFVRGNESDTIHDSDWQSSSSYQPTGLPQSYCGQPIYSTKPYIQCTAAARLKDYPWIVTCRAPVREIQLDQHLPLYLDYTRITAALENDYSGDPYYCVWLRISGIPRNCIRYTFPPNPTNPTTSAYVKWKATFVWSVDGGDDNYTTEESPWVLQGEDWTSTPICGNNPYLAVCAIYYKIKNECGDEDADWQLYYDSCP
jgi:hypothetical protein